MGTQILYDAGYAPRAMAEFFDKLAQEHKGSSMEQFFSNHPIPDNRIAKVNTEIQEARSCTAEPKGGFPRIPECQEDLARDARTEAETNPAKTLRAVPKMERLQFPRRRLCPRLE